MLHGSYTFLQNVRPRVPHCNIICQHVCEFGEICISGKCSILQEALRSRTQYTVAALESHISPEQAHVLRLRVTG
jgi:hypothetical protein